MVTALSVVKTVGYKAVARDALGAARWFADPRRRHRAKALVPGCESVHDWLALAGLFGGALQYEDELSGLFELLRPLEPTRACEIGTARGGTNMVLGRMLPSLEHLVGVDLFVRHRVQLRDLGRPGLRLSFISGSSYDPQTVDRVSKVLGGEKLDFLFIDGDHRYDGIVADFLSYRHLVRDGGVIAFHDIQPDGRELSGIVPRLPASLGAGLPYAGGVPVLWRRLRDHYPSREFIRDPTSQFGLGIGAITYSPDVALPDRLHEPVSVERCG